MKKIIIISQNLYNYKQKNRFRPKEYINTYSADYYAFQEYPDYGRGRTFYTTIVEPSGAEIECGCNLDVEKEWDKFFPWSEMPKRYWSETCIRIGHKRIVLINVHVSTSYSDQLRLILLRRLHQLKGKLVILVGDFNAAFDDQTEFEVKGNDAFLSMILNSKYVELIDETEKQGIPHYTFAILDKKNNVWLKKKLDHVFLSQTLVNDEKIDVAIEYMDSVNINCDKIMGYKTSNGISDHTGLKIIISLK